MNENEELDEPKDFKFKLYFEKLEDFVKTRITWHLKVGIFNLPHLIVHANLQRGIFFFFLGIHYILKCNMSLLWKNLKEFYLSASFQEVRGPENGPVRPIRLFLKAIAKHQTLRGIISHPHSPQWKLKQCWLLMWRNIDNL